MITDKRYRLCGCGNDMILTVIKEDTGEITRIVWDNMFPSRDLGMSAKIALKDNSIEPPYNITVYCQKCRSRRSLSTFSK